ncbi:major facilitator superfamily domain-containing protein [Amylostereum chailletii]|nr:major facilitator superfamily domain-containing protein [Amylostereum chailletii]
MANASHVTPPSSNTTLTTSPNPDLHPTDDGHPPLPVLEHNAAPSQVAVPAPEILDIEHKLVDDDPRRWSNTKKNIILFIVSSASVIAGLAANIYNPGITDIQRELHTGPGDISLSLSLFIMIQGVMPLLWSVISEIKGRKIVYIVSIAISVVGCIVAAEAKTIQVLIGMRCLQAIGSSAVMAIGAATLADIYEPSERGTKMGIYYVAPLMGPSLGPIIGGILTQYLSWRATFWALVIFMGLCLVMFVFFFRDTFRKERSLTYQAVVRRHQAMERARAREASKRSSTTTIVEPREEKEEGGEGGEKGVQKDVEKDIEKGGDAGTPPPMRDIKISLRDVNPLPPLIKVLRRWNNLVILTGSGLIFGFSYCITYTCARTLENVYHYNALDTGLVLLSYGIGSMGGSIFGGRWSDHVLPKLRAERGKHDPEMRLESTKIAMVFFPLPVIAYAWLAQNEVHVAALCVALFFAGFFSIWIYSSTLAYIVDANVGRSSSAVATNSAFRGTFAFVFAELAVPLQDGIGDGGLYSLWTGLVILCEGLVLVVLWWGGAWREKAERREREAEERRAVEGW